MQEVSIFTSKEATKPFCALPIMRVLMSKKNQIDIEVMRSLPLDDPRRKQIKQSLPCFTPSGMFSGRGAKNILIHSGCIALDFDHVNDPEALKAELIEDEFIFYAGLSCSGTGVVAYAEIENPALHKEYYKALIKYYADKGITLDPQCSDLGRIRFASYDPKPKVRHYDVKRWNTILPPQPQSEYKQVEYAGKNLDEELFYVGLDYILKYGRDITAGRNEWLKIGSFIKSLFSDSGECYFQQVSQFHPQYTKKHTADTYKVLSSKGYRGVFLNACTRAGIPPLKDLLISNYRKEASRE